jgi:hypothetical protein
MADAVRDEIPEAINAESMGDNRFRVLLLAIFPVRHCCYQQSALTA